MNLKDKEIFKIKKKRRKKGELYGCLLGTQLLG